MSLQNMKIVILFLACLILI